MVVTAASLFAAIYYRSRPGRRSTKTSRNWIRKSKAHDGTNAARATGHSRRTWHPDSGHYLGPVAARSAPCSDLSCALVLLANHQLWLRRQGELRHPILAVSMYAGLVLWLSRLFLVPIALLCRGMRPNAFNIKTLRLPTSAHSSIQADTNKALLCTCYQLNRCSLPSGALSLTSIGVAIVAGVKRSSGYIAVFGWWFAVIVLVIVGIAATNELSASHNPKIKAAHIARCAPLDF